MDLIRNPAFVFKATNVAVGGLLIAGAVGHFIWHSFSSIIIGVYALLFGSILIALELLPVPLQYNVLIHKYASFLYSFAGRGVFYVLAGVLLLSHYTLLYVSGSIVGFVGLVYFILEFVQTFDVPDSMVPPHSQEEESRHVWSEDQEV
ncbi:hypothetical protein FRC03_009407 [Tulasnella sp. 419]|nr:hypothetical protein FRC02_009395 [Tulasnella sp. 418]KAG8967714.1 hypothetical protein FRC03_009407 [Tulasnella sp. 419]